MQRNSLVLNVTKSNVLVLGCSNNGISLPDILLNGQKLSIVESVKYLGVHIDNKLNFKAHVQKTIEKFSQRVTYFGSVQIS